jgi:hypothetical protein
MILPYVRVAAFILAPTVLLRANSTDPIVTVPRSEIEVALPAELSKHRGVELHLRNGSVLRWNTLSVHKRGLSLRGGPGQEIDCASVTLIRVKRLSGSRTKRILGGVVGFIAGSLVASSLIFGVSESTGSDALAVGTVVASQATGAWLGQHLARGKVVWTTVLLVANQDP